MQATDLWIERNIPSRLRVDCSWIAWKTSFSPDALTDCSRSLVILMKISVFSGLAILCERKPVTLHTKHKSEDLLVSDSNGTHQVRLTFPFHCEQPGSAGTEGHVDHPRPSYKLNF